MKRPLLALASVAGYIGAVVLANLLTDRYHLVPVWPGLVTTAGTYAAGAALLLRDAVQDAAGRWVVLAAVLAAGAISWAMTNPTLAVASTVAFVAAELADFAIYTPLRRRSWARAVLVSNLVGAVIDTLLFLRLAGFPLATAVIAGQLVGKLLWATLLPVAAVKTAGRLRGA